MCRRASLIPKILGFALLTLVSAAVSAADGDNAYTLGPDSQFNPSVPHGRVTKHTFVAGPTSVYPGTVRDYWVYVPAQYNESRPACLMVFQDGGGYVSTNGSWRVPWVFDNLIASQAMPVTVGVFINPGVVPAVSTGGLPRFNRSYEYDGLGEGYAAFLLNELLPEVEKEVRIIPDPNGRAIAGASSGAIAAFTAAWERPDAFRRVFSTIGTYVGLRGGNNYPILVRKFEPKPLRVFLQDGYNDQNIYGGNWWIANLDMQSALAWAGYEVTNKWGTGGHDSKQGGSILPDALRWLWKDYPEPVRTHLPTNGPLGQILIPGEEWQLLGDGYKLPGGLVARRDGSVFFADPPENRIYQIATDGSISVHRADSGAAQNLAFNLQDRLIASQPGQQRITQFEGRNSEQILADKTGVKDIVADHAGNLWFLDPDSHSVRRMDARGSLATVDTGIDFPTGLCLSPDQTLLYVTDLTSQFVFSFQIQNDSTLAYKQPYFHLHLADNPRGSGADGLCVDADGRLYVASHAGIQVCDQAGRVNGILAKPEKNAWATDVCFGGRNMDELYLTAGDKVWRRKMRVKGVLPFLTPIQPKPPRL